MIKVEMNSFVLLYFAILLFFFLGSWFFNHLKQKKKKAISPAFELAVCEYCHFTYLTTPLKPVSKCPSCHLLNKENLYKH